MYNSFTMKTNFPPQLFSNYARNGKIDDIVDEFLMTEGDNVDLAKGLKIQKRYWFGPIEIALDDLIRSCGPEENVEFFEEQAVWDERVKELMQSIREGYLLPTFIVQYLDDKKLSIRDGNHRFEAYKRLEYKKYWALIWFDDASKLESFKNKYEERNN